MSSHNISEWPRKPILSVLTEQDLINPYPQDLSFGKNINSNQLIPFSLKKVVELIKGDRFKGLISEIRCKSEKKEKDQLKKQLPYFVVSGGFDENLRNSDNWIFDSGYVILDWDEYNEGRSKIKKNQLTNFPFISCVFLSPSNGLKIIVRTPQDETTKAAYLEKWNYVSKYLENELQIKVDPTGKDLSRTCYFSWDPECYFNPNAQVLTIPKNNRVQQNLVSKFCHSRSNREDRKYAFPKSGETLEQAVERVMAYIGKIQAIKGGSPSGHTVQFNVLLILTNGFGIRDRELLESLYRKWIISNSTPPPTENEIRHKLKQAWTVQPKDGKPIGHLNSDDSLSSFSIERLDSLKEVNVRIFPTHVFPPPVKTFIENFSKGSGAPVSFTATGVLACSAGLIEGFSLEVKPGYFEKPNLYLAVVGEPGVSKSPPIKAALNPLIQKETALSNDFCRRKKEYHKQYEKAASKKEKDAIPLPTRKPSRLITDGTTEGLLMSLNLMHEKGETPHAVIMRDELKGHFGAMNKYKAKGSGDDYELWLTLFSGGYTSRVLTSENFIIPDARASVIGGIQPEVYFKHMRDKGDGMLDRFMIAFHSGTPQKTSIFHSPDPNSIKFYNQFMNELDDLTPVRFSFWQLPDLDRKNVLDGVESFHQWAYSLGKEYDAGAFKKWEQNFYRLTIHMAVMWQKEQIDLETIDRASELAKYYANDWLQSKFQESDDEQRLRQDKKIRDKLEAAGKLGCTKTNFSQKIRDFKGPENKNALEKAIERLEFSDDVFRNEKGRFILKKFYPEIWKDSDES